MPIDWTPQMQILEFFTFAYRKYPRYWTNSSRNPYSFDPADQPSALWRKLLVLLNNPIRGRILDLGAGEGTDAIRLARMGYQVDAVEGTQVGAEKIERFAREAGVKNVNIIHANVKEFTSPHLYDVVICNGLLHYIEPEAKLPLLRKIADLTAPGGYNMVMSFTDYNPIPDCHKIIAVYPDSENGVVRAFYGDWEDQIEVVEHEKPDHSHADFPLHQHSMIKVMAKKPQIR